MKKDIHHYIDYKADDFVLDPNFRNWVLNPDKSSNIYWQDWIKANPSKVTDIKKARELLLSIQTIDYKPTEGVRNEVWEGITSGIKNGVSKESKVLPLSPHSIISRYDNEQNSRSFPWRGIAASIALFIVSILVAYQYFVPSQQIENQMVETVTTKENPLGQRSTFVMSDGTKVTLNADSKLSYASSYGQSNRVVRLEGEAFFEVAKNEVLPFIVETSYLSTKALGTSFNISAFNEEGFEVSLFTGLVNVYGNSENNQQYSEDLSPGERITLGSDNIYAKSDFSLEDQASWRNGILSFRKTTFEAAMVQLERWYAVSIEYPKDLPEDLTFSGDFDNEYLTSVLEVLGYNMGFTYQLKDKQVKITFNEK
ncbi:MAG: FecR domain-containing protein [Cyclobacteriaceae bacterium]|nr:FecR domain-containing protein [Cyclobacteriaceae bacterium SS2]